MLMSVMDDLAWLEVDLSRGEDYDIKLFHWIVNFDLFVVILRETDW